MKHLKFSRSPLTALLMSGFLLSMANGALAQLNQVNLLVNGDFKKGMEGWAASSWAKKGEASIDPTEHHEDKPALKVVNSGVDDTQVNQKITLKQHTRYKLSGMIKTKDVEPGKKNNKEGAALVVQGAEKSKALQRTTSWTRIYLEIDTGPRTDFLLGPRLGHNWGSVIGTAWFADLSLVELGPGRK